jgi:hypothetical protein
MRKIGRKRMRMKLARSLWREDDTETKDGTP